MTPLTPDSALPPVPRPDEEFAEYVPEPEAESVDIRRYLSAIWRFKWLIVLLSTAGFAVGYGLNSLVLPVYEAQASVQLPASTRGFGAQNPLRSVPLLEGRAWLELVRSFEVLDEVVRQQRLYLEPFTVDDTAYFSGFVLAQGFNPGPYQLTRTAAGRLQLSRPDGNVVDDVAIGDSVGLRAGFRWVPPAPPEGRIVGFRVREPRDAAVRLGDALGTNLPQDGALLRMWMRSPDPVLAAATVNATAHRFVEVATLLKREKLTTVTEVLGQQLESARADLAAAESSLEQYQVTTITLPNDRGASPISSGLAETRDPVRQAFFQLRLDREDLVRDRDAVRRALAGQTDTTRSIIVSLGTIRAVRDSRELSTTLEQLTLKRAEARQMRLAFSAAHPPLRLLEREIAELDERIIPEQANAVIANLEQRIADFDQRIAASSREMQQIPLRSTEESRRVRNVEVAQLIYTELQSAYESARLSELSAAPDVRVLDSAVPPTRPVRDQMLIIIFGATFAGFGLGLLLAILLDRFDKHIRYPDQVTHGLGLQILGALPLLKQTKNGKPNESAEQMLEAMRSVRMAMLYAHGTAGSFITTVTSPGSGDGKSFVSGQLANSFALSGRKTILIDGDNRRGYLHRTHSVQRTPGLMDFLAGKATRAEIVRKVADGGFDLVPAGLHRANAPELLASPEMQRFVNELKRDYQAIIIDSPPLAAGVDALILASLSGTMIMVVRNGVTDRDLAAARLGDLNRLPIRTLGAVLNDVRPEGVYRYYSYLPGYRTEDEVVEPAALPPKKRISGPR